MNMPARNPQPDAESADPEAVELVPGQLRSRIRMDDYSSWSPWSDIAIPEQQPDRPEYTFVGMMWGFLASIGIVAALYVIAAFVCAVGPGQ